MRADIKRYLTCLVGTLILVGPSCSTNDNGDASPPGTTPVPRTLDLAAAVTQTGITVTNNNEFNWSDCNVQIDTETSDLNPWEHEPVAELNAGHSAFLAFVDFSRHATDGAEPLDGKRFEELQFKRLILVCQTPQGAGFSDLQL